MRGNSEYYYKKCNESQVRVLKIRINLETDTWNVF